MGRIEKCCTCGEATGNSPKGQNSLYAEDEGPFCQDCWAALPTIYQRTIQSLKASLLNAQNKADGLMARALRAETDVVDLRQRTFKDAAGLCKDRWREILSQLGLMKPGDAGYVAMKARADEAKSLYETIKGAPMEDGGELPDAAPAPNAVCPSDIKDIVHAAVSACMDRAKAHGGEEIERRADGGADWRDFEIRKMEALECRAAVQAAIGSAA